MLSSTFCTPIDRSPEEMVGAAVFLFSEACSFMTGETVFDTCGYWHAAGSARFQLSWTIPLDQRRPAPPLHPARCRHGAVHRPQVRPQDQSIVPIEDGFKMEEMTIPVAVDQDEFNLSE